MAAYGEPEGEPENNDPPVMEFEYVSEFSESPPFSSVGLIHWMYGRCERRLNKAVIAKGPYKVCQYQARQGSLTDMLSFLETATDEESERMEHMLREISDLSSDEDSPTRNGTSSRLAFMVLVPISCVDATVEHPRIR